MVLINLGSPYCDCEKDSGFRFGFRSSRSVTISIRYSRHSSRCRSSFSAESLLNFPQYLVVDEGLFQEVKSIDRMYRVGYYFGSVGKVSNVLSECKPLASFRSPLFDRIEIASDRAAYEKIRIA